MVYKPPFSTDFMYGWNAAFSGAIRQSPPSRGLEWYAGYDAFRVAPFEDKLPMRDEPIYEGVK